MGCVSSTFLQPDLDTDSSPQTGLTINHIVSLTSTTYGLITLDSPQHTPPTFHPITPPSLEPTRFEPPNRFSPKSNRSGSLNPDRSEPPETINSWELMADLDRFSPEPFQRKSLTLLKTVSDLDNLISKTPRMLFRDEPVQPGRNRNEFGRGFAGDLPVVLKNTNIPGHENSDPNRSNYSTHMARFNKTEKSNLVQLVRPGISSGGNGNVVVKYKIDDFERLCPFNGEGRVVIYTTSLRGVRKTFEECNAVRDALRGTGVVVYERDVSMHKAFINELREALGLVKCSNGGGVGLPKVFIKGRYIGGAEEVLRIHEEGCLGNLVEGLPKARVGVVCDGCGGVRFLPCFECNGSCKVLNEMKDGRRVVVKCGECNENGLVLCPICS